MSMLALVEWRNILLTWTNADQTTQLTKCCTFQFLKILSRTLFLQSNTDSRFSAHTCRLLEPYRYRYSSKLLRNRACRKRKKCFHVTCALACHDSRMLCRPYFANLVLSTRLIMWISQYCIELSTEWANERSPPPPLFTNTKKWANNPPPPIKKKWSS